MGRLDPPPTVSVRVAAEAVGVCLDSAYDSIQAGKWPTPVIRVGRSIRIPTKYLIDLIGESAMGAVLQGAPDQSVVNVGTPTGDRSE